MSRIGVFVCWCGENIARTVDVERVAEEVAKLPGVRCAHTYKYTCSDPGQAMIREKIASEKLDGVVRWLAAHRTTPSSFSDAIFSRIIAWPGSEQVYL